MGYQTDQKNNKNIFQKKKGQSFHETLCKRFRKCAEMLKVNFANKMSSAFILNTINYS
jgi:hypothetical protein